MTLAGDSLSALGFKRVGRDCAIHETVQFFGVENISLGDNVRIDCFSLISAGPDGIEIGSHIHIGAGAFLFGGGARIVIEDFAGVSPRAMIFTATDDFVGGYFRGPTVPERFRNVRSGNVVLCTNAQIGAGSVVLPGVVVGVNATVGALTLVKKNVPEHTLVVGNPPREVTSHSAESSERFLSLMQQFASEQEQ